MSEPPHNPYVGPRAFRSGERLFGRERETNQLTNLLIAERIVLLYSPSGAGKSSLIEAALVPRLQKMQFQVLPTIRVNAQVEGSNGANRYLSSTLASLQAALPESALSPEITLSQALLQVPQPSGGRGVDILIFDQFEEVLSLDPTDGAAKTAFFRQVGEALAAGNRWALFAMREDYLAALDPYLLLIPNRFTCGFRLDLLGRAEAVQAVREPALANGVQFEPAAAEKLVDDLCRVRVQRPDGSLEVQPGPTVEPVQLQVVCRQLWDAPRADPARIQPADLAALGQVDGSLVDRALAGYFSSSAASAAAESGAGERAIREWVERRLITPSGERNTLRLEAGSSGGLDNDAIQALIDAHLVRKEQRSGAAWFELAHDRLVNPVRRDNAEWFKTHLSRLQQRADAWAQSERPDSMLLRGAELSEAEDWAGAHALLPDEVDFLEKSRALRKTQRRNRILIAALAAAGVVAFISLLFALASYQEARGANQAALWSLQTAQAANQQAQTSARAARAGQLAALALNGYEDTPARSLLLAVEALDITRQAGEPPVPAAHAALRELLSRPHGAALGVLPAAARRLAASSDGRFVAAGTEAGLIWVWDLQAAAPAPQPLETGGQTLTAMQFQPGAHLLAAATSAGGIYLWDLDGADLAAPVELRLGADWVQTLAFSPDGQRLAAGGVQGELRIWELAAPDRSRGQVLPTPVQALAFSRDGRLLAAGGLDGVVRLLDGSGALLAESHSDPAQPPRQVTALAFSPDGGILAAGGLDDFVTVWNVTARELAENTSLRLAHGSQVSALFFSQDGRYLVAAALGSLLVWEWEEGDLSAEKPAGPGLVPPQSALRRLPVSTGGRLAADINGGANGATNSAFTGAGPGDSNAATANLAAAGGEGRALVIWDVADPDAQPLQLYGHDGALLGVAFLPGGRLVSSAADGSLRLWDLANLHPTGDPLLVGSGAPLQTVAFTPGGEQVLAVAGQTLVSANLPAPGAALEQAQVRQFAIQLDVQLAAANASASRLAVGGFDDIHVWDLAELSATGAATDLANAATGAAADAAANAAANATATLSAGAAANPPAPMPPARFVLEKEGSLQALALSPDGSWLAAVLEGGGLQTWLWRLDQQSEPLILPAPSSRSPGLQFSPDGRRLMAWGGGAEILVWDLNPDGGQPVLQRLADGVQPVRAAAFSQDGQRLAAWGLDRRLLLWDLSGEPQAQEIAAQVELTTLGFAPGSAWLWGGGSDGRLFAWNLAQEGQLGQVFSSHSAAVDEIAFDPQLAWLASRAGREQARLSFLAGGTSAAQPIDLPGGGVQSLAFSPDGRWLAGAGESALLLWNLNLSELMAQACTLAGRNLSQDEWQQFFPGEEYRSTCAQTSP